MAKIGTRSPLVDPSLTMRLTTLLAYPLILGVAPVFAVYSFVKEYSGSSFFSDWDFGNGTYDRTTHGMFTLSLILQTATI